MTVADGADIYPADRSAKMGTSTPAGDPEPPAGGCGAGHPDRSYRNVLIWEVPMVYLISPECVCKAKVCTWLCVTNCGIKPCYGVDPEPW